MLNYLARAEIGGVEIRLIESQFGFCVLYGMEKTFERVFTGPDAKESARAAAWYSFGAALEHAAACAGILESVELD